MTSVEFQWKPPKHSGGCPVTSYTIERQQVGRNKWTDLGEIPGSILSYKDSDVNPGRRYCYRIRAKNAEGVSDHLQTGDIAAGVLRESLALASLWLFNKRETSKEMNTFIQSSLICFMISFYLLYIYYILLYI